MITVLDFEKPKKVRSTKDHNNRYMSDSGIAGTYVPNMSDADMAKFKAKHIKGDDERIEIRKSIDGVQLLIIVYKHEYQPPKPEFPDYDGGSRDSYWEQANAIYSADRKNYDKRHGQVQMSMNGKLNMSLALWFDINEAVKEAFEILL
jgi:hypothetical protein